MLAHEWIAGANLLSLVSICRAGLVISDSCLDRLENNPPKQLEIWSASDVNIVTHLVLVFAPTYVKSA